MGRKLISSLKLATSESSPIYFVEVNDFENKVQTLSDPRANRALIGLMNMHSVNGGAACHWGGGSAFAEIMSSLHGLFFKHKNWFDYYNFVNDAGHTENGIYALRANYKYNQLSFDDLKGFRSISSPLTGHGEVHLNPEGVLVSNGPLGSGLPQAQGLAMADCVLKNNRLTVCTISDGALMEGEAKESLAAIPGFAKKQKLNPFVLVLSDNKTKLSGRIDQDSFDMNPSFESLSTLGWDTRVIKQGNHLQTVYLELEKAFCDAQNNSKKPIFLWVKTIKGYGIKATEESLSGGHGFPLKKNDSQIVHFLKEIYQGLPVPQELMDWANSFLKPNLDKTKLIISPSTSVVEAKVQTGIAEGMIEAKKLGYPLVSISADLQGSTGVAPFHKKFPKESFEVGVSESNMISNAIGFSIAGFIPVVDTFAQFGITKGNLPILMANLSKAPVICVFSHTGFQDAADGASHQALHYISAVAAIPKTTVICCTSKESAKAYMLQAVEKIQNARENNEEANSIVIFIGRENFPIYTAPNLSYSWGIPQLIESGKDVTLVATGSLFWNAQKAVKELSKENISVNLVDHSFINHPNISEFKNFLDQTSGRLVTVEDHRFIGGMGSILSHTLLQAGVSLTYQSVSIGDEFGRSAYIADDLYALNNMGVSDIIKVVKQVLLS